MRQIDRQKGREHTNPLNGRTAKVYKSRAKHETDRKSDIQTDRQSDGQTGIQTDRQTDIQIYMTDR